MEINVTLDVMLAKRKMSVTELSERIGITMANVSILKNGKAKGTFTGAERGIRQHYAKDLMPSDGQSECIGRTI